jgi:hypothetical protein
MKRTAMISILSMIACPLFSWEDHPEKDSDRIYEGGRSIDCGYDWSKRDPEGNNSNSSRESDDDERGANTPPDKD